VPNARVCPNLWVSLYVHCCWFTVLDPLQLAFLPVGQVADLVNVYWASRRLVVIPAEILRLENVTDLSTSWANVLRESNTINRTALSTPACYRTMTALKTSVDSKCVLLRHFQSLTWCTGSVT
jgi:hypothetical protein